MNKRNFKYSLTLSTNEKGIPLCIGEYETIYYDFEFNAHIEIYHPQNYYSWIINSCENIQSFILVSNNILSYFVSIICLTVFNPIPLL